MESKEVTRRGAWVLLTPGELLIISNALNEVCNGIDIPEFSTRMGVSLEEVQSLLKSIGVLYDQVAGK